MNILTKMLIVTAMFYCGNIKSYAQDDEFRKAYENLVF